jgi:peptidoglycan/LPS O-acetylase OafA/YrhL
MSLFDAPASALQAAVAAMLDVFNALLAYRFQHQLYPGPMFHYWSLSLEEQFYFAVPFIILLSRRWLILALLCAISLICATRGPYGGVFRFEELFSGLALAAFEEGGQRLSGLDGTLIRLRRFLPLLSFALLLGVMQLDASTLRASQGPLWHQWLERLGISAGSTLLVYLASRDCGGLVGRGVVHRLFLGIGRRSYSIYLAHISAFFGAREIVARLGSPGMEQGNTAVLTLSIGLGLLAVFSETTYRLVEKRAWRKPAFPAFSEAAPLALSSGTVIAVLEPSERI